MHIQFKNLTIFLPQKSDNSLDNSSKSQHFLLLIASTSNAVQYVKRMHKHVRKSRIFLTKTVQLINTESSFKELNSKSTRKSPFIIMYLASALFFFFFLSQANNFAHDENPKNISMKLLVHHAEKVAKGSMTTKFPYRTTHLILYYNLINRIINASKIHSFLFL